MFRLSVLQDQWLTLAMLGGLVLVLEIALTCMAFWRSGDEPAPDGAPARRARMPLILIVTYIAMAAFVVVYVLYMASRPPNW